VAVGGSTVYRTKRRFVEGNLEAALNEEPRAGADRKLTSCGNWLKSFPSQPRSSPREAERPRFASPTAAQVRVLQRNTQIAVIQPTV
jgi:hypothetical protein